MIRVCHNMLLGLLLVLVLVIGFTPYTAGGTSALLVHLNPQQLIIPFGGTVRFSCEVGTTNATNIYFRHDGIVISPARLATTPWLSMDSLTPVEAACASDSQLQQQCLRRDGSIEGEATLNGTNFECCAVSGESNECSGPVLIIVIITNLCHNETATSTAATTSHVIEPTSTMEHLATTNSGSPETMATLQLVPRPTSIATATLQLVPSVTPTSITSGKGAHNQPIIGLLMAALLIVFSLLLTE